VLLLILAAAALLGRCASWQFTPYDGRPFCDLAGGFYTADGRCVTGGQ
jgi:hypothetical protein